MSDNDNDTIGAPLTDKGTVGRVERRGKGYDRHADVTRPVSSGGKRGGKAPKAKPEPYVLGQEVVLVTDSTTERWYVYGPVVDICPDADAWRLSGMVTIRVSGVSQKKLQPLVGHLTQLHRDPHRGWMSGMKDAKVSPASITWFEEEAP
jgi:hypothetical protein